MHVFLGSSFRTKTNTGVSCEALVRRPRAGKIGYGKWGENSLTCLPRRDTLGAVCGGFQGRGLRSFFHGSGVGPSRIDSGAGFLMHESGSVALLSESGAQERAISRVGESCCLILGPARPALGSYSRGYWAVVCDRADVHRMQLMFGR